MEDAEEVEKEVGHSLDEAGVKGLLTTVTNMLLCLEFGWTGSPGHFGKYGTAAEKATERQGPEETRVNGESGFFLRTWVDDGISVEPDLGYRPYLAVRTYERAVKTLLGESAINREKMAEEGETGTKVLAWGLNVDTEEDTFSLPDAKWQKAQYLLALPMFEWGCRRLERREVQVLRGNATFWKTVCPAVRPETALVTDMSGEWSAGGTPRTAW